MATERQKKLLKKISENIGNSPTRKLMVEANYSQSYADSGHIKETKSWQQLMDKYISDEVIAKSHAELLNQNRAERILLSSTMTSEEVDRFAKQICPSGQYYFSLETKTDYKGKVLSKLWMLSVALPNHEARGKAIEMAYKLKGMYAPEKYQDITDSEEISLDKLEERNRELEAKIRRITTRIKRVKGVKKAKRVRKV